MMKYGWVVCFILQADLVKHMRSHSAEKPFSCQLCDKTFKSRSFQAIHMRTHTGNYTFSCVGVNHVMALTSPNTISNKIIKTLADCANVFLTFREIKNSFQSTEHTQHRTFGRAVSKYLGLVWVWVEHIVRGKNGLKSRAFCQFRCREPDAKLRKESSCGNARITLTWQNKRAWVQAVFFSMFRVVVMFL